MKDLRDYLVVTAAYWSFMLTDGALRMLVLLYFDDLGYPPVSLAFLFLLYELCGVATNFVGGWLATRYGLKLTLVWGLGLQVGAIVMLSFLDAGWSTLVGISYVMAAQALSGVAKDLTKMSAKTAVKALVPADQASALYKWVAILTGSKNAVKGVGFFVGALLLQVAGFRHALWIMGGLIALTFVAAMASLPQVIGKPAVKKAKLSGMFRQGRNINLLSTARVFLFGARDIWFVVGVPVYLSSQFGWSFSRVGGFMAAWVIGYGGVQMIAPAITRWRSGGRAPGGRVSLEVIGLLLLCMLGILAGHLADFHPGLTIIGGLGLFGLLFAVNSSVHSYMILDYADGDKAAMSVGFYYMANAVGRLLGTLLSGLLYQLGGLTGCLAGSAAFLAITAIVTLWLPPRALHDLDAIVGPTGAPVATAD